MPSIFKSSISKPLTHQPPEPTSNSFWGYQAEYFRDPFSFLSKCSDKYGDIVLLNLGKYKFYFISSPNYIEQILVTNSTQFAKPDLDQFMNKLLGNGLVTSEGDFWHRQRKLMQPTFHNQHLANYQEIILSSTNCSIETWKFGQTREICQEMKNLVLKSMMKIMFDSGIARDSKEVKKIIRVGTDFFTQAFDRRLYSFPRWIMTPARLRLRKTFKSFDNLIYGIIRRRRTTTESKSDMLSMLQSVQDVDGNAMTDQQVRDEIMTLMVAASETVSMALSWTWYLLSQNPKVEAKLIAELQAVLGDKKPSIADFPQLRYTEMVVMEVLRLYPPDWFLSRKVIMQDCEIGGYAIPVGSTVCYSQWVAHRDKRFFEKPEVFNPERWNSDLAKTLPKFAYFPFGGGSRSCFGKPLAMMLMILIITNIAQKFHLKLVPNHQVIPYPGVTLKPKYGVKMLVNKRE
ncbi:cytochrome P450 [Halotia wernerae UHCC 0503]|nr:cytochrome P450 [Halotia wernerae UHCC 0503]